MITTDKLKVLDYFEKRHQKSRTFNVAMIIFSLVLIAVFRETHWAAVAGSAFGYFAACLRYESITHKHAMEFFEEHIRS